MTSCVMVEARKTSTPAGRSNPTVDRTYQCASVHDDVRRLLASGLLMSARRSEQKGYEACSGIDYTNRDSRSDTLRISFQGPVEFHGARHLGANECRSNRHPRSKRVCTRARTERA